MTVQRVLGGVTPILSARFSRFSLLRMALATFSLSLFPLYCGISVFRLIHVSYIEHSIYSIDARHVNIRIS